MNGPWLAVAIGCAALAATASAADGALLVIDEDDEAALPPEARALVARRDRGHRALAILRRLLQVGAGVAAARSAALALMPARDATLAAAAMAVVVVVLAESLARAAGEARRGRALAPLTGFVLAVERLTRPVTALAERLDLTLRRLLPEPAPDEEAREESVEQFSAVVAAEAEVPRTEQALLRRVFAFGETEVKEVMVPRVDIVGIEIDTPWSEVVDRVRASAHARLPVYRETLDDIVGVLYAKDLLPAVIEGEEPEGGWARLVRPAVYLPPTKPIDEHLREARASGTHLAIVVDEYGGTAGLVTVEDILEELVGEIRDETDTDEDEALETEPGRWWVDGGVSLARLSEATGRNFETDGITTVGGLVFALAGRVPRAGETFEVHGFRLVVERVRRRRVARVYLERLPVAEPAEADA